MREKWRDWKRLQRYRGRWRTEGWGVEKGRMWWEEWRENGGDKSKEGERREEKKGGRGRRD